MIASFLLHHHWQLRTLLRKKRKEEGFEDFEMPWRGEWSGLGDIKWFTG